MDAATLADTIRNVAFRPTQFRGGYDEVAVDQLLDDLERAVTGGAPGTEVASIVSRATLPATSMRRGYDRDDVDAFLADVSRQATGLAPQPSRTPAAPMPAAQERVGFGSRLLRLLRGD